MAASQAEKLKKPFRRNWLAAQLPPSIPVKQVSITVAVFGL
jgi:hypothetical protein